jgi:hypothetical protein
MVCRFIIRKLAIANNPAKPSFQNTVLALEISGVDLKSYRRFL